MDQPVQQPMARKTFARQHPGDPDAEGQVVQSENVRVALDLVARGEAALGIVYGSDAVAEPKVHVRGTFPADSHKPIVYPGAVTANAAEATDAADFLAYLAQDAGPAFEAQGFTVLSK